MPTDEHATAIDKAVFPGLQGGPHNHTTAGIAVALHEAAHRRRSATTPTRSSPTPRRWPTALTERGFDLVSGGTDNHLILIDLTGKGIGGKPAAKALDRAGIETQLQHRARSTRASRSTRPGIRLGTPALTTRGLTEAQMPQVADWIDARGRRRASRTTRPRSTASPARCATCCPPTRCPGTRPN